MAKVSNENVETVARMLEAFPTAVQTQAVEQLREYLADITDELRWDESFERTSANLAAFAQKARKQIQDGKAKEMDFSKL